MSWAQELKSLVEDIQSSKVDRARLLNDLAADVRNLLKKSEHARLEDYKTLHQRIQEEFKGIQATVKQIREESGEIRADAREFMGRLKKELKELAADLKEFLKKSNHNRKADFKSMMEDIAASLKQIHTEVVAVQHETVSMLRSFSKERKDAAGAWASLGHPRKAHGAAHKRGRPRKT